MLLAAYLVQPQIRLSLEIKDLETRGSKNKGTDQAVLLICAFVFLYMLMKFSHDTKAMLVSEVVRNSKDRFSGNEAHLS